MFLTLEKRINFSKGMYGKSLPSTDFAFPLIKEKFCHYNDVRSPKSSNYKGKNLTFDTPDKNCKNFLAQLTSFSYPAFWSKCKKNVDTVKIILFTRCSLFFFLILCHKLSYCLDGYDTKNILKKQEKKKPLFPHLHCCSFMDYHSSNGIKLAMP